MAARGGSLWPLVAQVNFVRRRLLKTMPTGPRRSCITESLNAVSELLIEVAGDQPIPEVAAKGGLELMVQLAGGTPSASRRPPAATTATATVAQVAAAPAATAATPAVSFAPSAAAAPAAAAPAASPVDEAIKEESLGPSPVELVAFARLYESHQGNVFMLAKACGVSVTLLKNNAPADGQEFAVNLLQGGYSEETAEKAKANLREKLPEIADATDEQIKRKKFFLYNDVNGMLCDEPASLEEEKKYLKEIKVLQNLAKAISDIRTRGSDPLSP